MTDKPEKEKEAISPPAFAIAFCVVIIAAYQTNHIGGATAWTCLLVATIGYLLVPGTKEGTPPRKR